MKGLLRLLILLCLALPVRAQYIEQCLTISGFSDTDGNGYGYNVNSTIRANDSKEIVMLGDTKIFRVSKEGSKLWEKTITAVAYDYNINSNGNVAVIHNNGFKLTKYNSNGTLAWEKTFSDQYVFRLAMDNSDNIYASGYDYNSGGLYLVKYSSNGTFQWQKIIADGFGNALATNSTGDVYVMGPDYFNGGNRLIKYNSGGTLQWQKTINYNFASNILKVGPDGTVYAFLHDNFSTRALKINAGSGGTLYDELIDIGRIVVAFGPSNTVYLLGTNGSELYTIYKLNNNFTGGTFKNLNYFMLNSWDYKTIEVESDGTVSASTIGGFDEREGVFYTLNSAGDITGGIGLYFNGLALTGHIVDYQGNFLIGTDGNCLKKLTLCSRIPFLINTQPTNQTVCSGSDAQFTVAATGAGPLYQWKKGSVYLRNDAKYAGVNSPTLTVKAANPVDDAGSYVCEIFDACYVEPNNPGDPERKLTTQAVSISFIGPATITGQPSNVSQCAGTDAIFKITTSGGQNVKYQWRKGTTPLIEGSTVVGSKTNQLTLKSIGAGDAGLYTCDVTSDCFNSAQVTQQAQLTLLPATTISQQPVSVSTCAGSTAVFTIAGSGTGLTYQWRKGGVNLSESATAVGTKTTVLSIKNVGASNVGDYTCVVTGSCGNPVTSSNAALTVSSASQITSQPVSKEICAGANVSFTVAASGSALVYSWRKGNVVLANGGKYSGATTATLNISSTTAAEEGQYSCVISSSCGADLISTVAQLVIGSAPSITGKSADLKLCEGEVAKMSVTVSGGLIKYQWKKNGTPLSDGNGILGSKARELFIEAIGSSDAGNYTCDVSTDCGAVQVSGIIKLELLSELSINPDKVTIKGCVGSKTTITAAVTGTVQSYQWKRNGVNLGNNATFSGVKTSTLTIQNTKVTEEGFYSCEVLSGCGKLLMTTDTKVEVNNGPALELLDVDCNAFPTEWSSIVMDANNIFGEYQIFKKGSDKPLAGLTSATQTGVYIIMKSNGVCTDTVEWNNDCVVTGIEEQLAELSITPNPASGSFSVKHKLTSDQFEMYDSRGVSVLSNRLNGSAETIVDVTSLADGVYYFILSTNDGKRISKRIVIRR
jgi:hypothetical protein